MQSKVAVVDYGIGNVYSVCNALKKIGADPILTGDHAVLRDADRIILPGVGAYARAMEALKQRGLDDRMREYAQSGRPLMGICIGMQVFMEKSYEFGEHEGLGLFDGIVERIVPEGETDVRVPHIAWSEIAPSSNQIDLSGTPITTVCSGTTPFYFVHSYHCKPANDADRLETTKYCGQTLTAAIRKDAVFGVQFHPERSGAAGFEVLRQFAKS